MKAKNVLKTTILCILLLFSISFYSVSFAHKIIKINSNLSKMVADSVWLYIYVSDKGTNSVLFLNTFTDTIEKSVFVGSNPSDMDISADNSTLYVAISGGSSVSVIDLDTQTVVDTIELGFTPTSLAAGRPDRLYVSDCNEIRIIDTTTKTIVGSFSDGKIHAVDSTGSYLFESGGCFYSYPSMKKWDISTDSPDLILDEHIMGSGCNYEDIHKAKLSPDDSRIYIVSSCIDDGIIPAHNTTNYSLEGQLILEWQPIALTLTPNGSKGYAAHTDWLKNPTQRKRHDRFRKDIHVFNTITFTEEDWIAVKDYVAEDGLVVTPDGSKLYAIIGSPPNQHIEVFTVVPVTLTTPNGGEVIPSGSKYTIQWVPPLGMVSFKLKYSMDNGTTWKPIESGIVDTSYDWPVPTPKKNKKKCLVKVIGYDGSDEKIGADKSDAPFTIAVVEVTSPNGGEVLISGDPHTITWTTNETKEPVTKVVLKYTKNGGKKWKKIDTLTENLGFYDWTVPDVPKTKNKCKVKVELKALSGKTVGSDTSDGYFTIQP